MRGAGQSVSIQNAAVVREYEQAVRLGSPRATAIRESNPDLREQFDLVDSQTVTV